MFVERRTPLTRQHGETPGVWLVVRQDNALAFLEIRIANGVQLQKISRAETPRYGLRWQPKVIQKAPFRIEARGLERQWPQGTVAFHPLAQRQALECDNIAFAPASLLRQKICTGCLQGGSRLRDVRVPVLLQPVTPYHCRTGLPDLSEQHQMRLHGLLELAHLVRRQCVLEKEDALVFSVPTCLRHQAPCLGGSLQARP